MNENTVLNSKMIIGGGYSRDTTIDIVKGMGIILMVLRHARAPYSDFVLLFHMAIFFIASGYLYNSNRIHDARSLGTYAVKKIKSLWLPYFAFNSIYILCNNLFLRINFYTDNPAFLNADGSELTYRSLAEYLSIKDMANQVIKAAFFHGETQIGGALWFFYVLFVVSILYAAIDLLLVKIKNHRKKIIINGFISLIFLIIGYVCMMKGISIKGISRAFSVYSLVYLGQLIRMCGLKECVKDKLIFNICAIVLPLAVLVACYHRGYIDLSSNTIENPAFFILVSFCGWLMLYGFAAFLERLNFSGNNAICYISIHSVPIIAMHFLCFKIVNAAAVMLLGMDTYMISSHPVLMYSGFWWLAYTVIGLVLPLTISFFFWTGWKSIRR